MIKKSVVFLFAVLLIASFVSAVDHKFVGVGTCKMCHKGAAKGGQFEIWEKTKHAGAFESLKSEAALKVAKDRGLKTPPSETAECLKCHVTAVDAAAGLVDAKFDRTQGVQCESCHGAGGDYKAIATMKDEAKAIENGLAKISVKDGSAEAQCKKCHNSESPFFKGFNMSEMWAKIQHPLPAAK